MVIPIQNDLHESTNRLEDLYQSLNEGDIVKKRWRRHFFKVLIFIKIRFFERGKKKKKRLLFRLAVERDDMEKQILDGENQMRSDFQTIKS